jgi:hypothetical protein
VLVGINRNDVGEVKFFLGRERDQARSVIDLLKKQMEAAEAELQAAKSEEAAAIDNVVASRAAKIIAEAIDLNEKLRRQAF